MVERAVKMQYIQDLEELVCLNFLQCSSFVYWRGWVELSRKLGDSKVINWESGIPPAEDCNLVRKSRQTLNTDPKLRESHGKHCSTIYVMNVPRVMKIDRYGPR